MPREHGQGVDEPHVLPAETVALHTPTPEARPPGRPRRNSRPGRGRPPGLPRTTPEVRDRSHPAAPDKAGRSWQAAATSGPGARRRSTSRSTAAARKRSVPGRMRTKRSVNPWAVSVPGAMVTTGTPFLRSCRTRAAACTEPRARSRPTVDQHGRVQDVRDVVVAQGPEILDTGRDPGLVAQGAVQARSAQAAEKEGGQGLDHAPVAGTAYVQDGQRLGPDRRRSSRRTGPGPRPSRCPATHSPVFRRGERSRCGLTRRLRCTSSLGQTKPRVKGWSGLPRRRGPSGPSFTTREQASGQSRVQALITMYSPYMIR